MSENEKQDAILIVDDVPENIGLLLEYLSDKGYKILVAENGESAIEQVAFAKPDLILLDIMMPGISGFETCKYLKRQEETKHIPVIFMTALSDSKNIVKGFSIGAVDYITKPIRPEEVLARVKTHLALRKLQKELRDANKYLEKRVTDRTAELGRMNSALREEVRLREKASKELEKSLAEVEKLKNRLQDENVYLREEIRSESNFGQIVTRSTKITAILKQVEQVAKTDSTALILGETGTGKELFARAIHSGSLRADKPLVKVNCAALPGNLIESELFGHEKGAFTGALSRKIGRFELADKGAIFLDEVGDIPIELQSKLLRVLQEGEFERLGNPRTIRSSARVIAATNIDLKKAILEGKFREDLYYRLNVFPVKIPPLRERPEDISILAEHFVKKFCKKMGRGELKINKRTYEKLERYSWPGNVRELENVIERAVIVSPGPSLTIDDPLMPDEPEPIAEKGPKTIKQMEKEYIERELIKANWIIEGGRGAAKKLGLPASTLRDRMRKYGISRPED